MPVVNVPVTTYQAKSGAPNRRFGSPAALVVRDARAQVFMRVSMDRIPRDATITSAILRFYSDRSLSGSLGVQVAPITGAWSSNITWNNRPNVGATIVTKTVAGQVRGTLWEWNVTAWANTRDVRGLRLSTGSDIPMARLAGSSAAALKPVLVVTYTVPNPTPGMLVPDGGHVSVASPIITYSGDDDMTQQNIQFSTDGGSTVAFDTGWIAATDGVYDTASAGVPVPASGSTIHWRVRTQSPDGVSGWSSWAWYTYTPLPVVAITNPGATTDDGTPPLTWTVSTAQTSYKAEIYNSETGVRLQDSAWVNAPADRSWTPSRGVRVPDGVGRFDLYVRDNVTPRVAATNAPTHVRVSTTFTTAFSDSGAGVDTLSLDLSGPVPVLTGSRAAGVPDEIGLFRDGVQVPLWDADGIMVMWAPGVDFFTGTSFSIPDYTATPKTESTWSVKTRINGQSSLPKSVTGTYWTGTVWMVDPRTGDAVEILGSENSPVVDQQVEEQAIVHTPINLGLQTEPRRRRLLRTTRMGSVVGTVSADEDVILERWVLDDSGLRYRLIFGRVNWSVIIGDYVPSEVFYGSQCDPDWIRVSLNWWERLDD